MSCAVVIVNYRTPALVADCLESIAADPAPPEGLRVVVVDNASGDGSYEAIAEKVRSRNWTSWIDVRALPRNGGFAYGNNAAIRIAREARPDLRTVVLLNPDTVVKPGALKALVDYLEARPRVGIAGGGIDAPDGSREASSHRFPSPLGELEGAAAFGPLSRLLRRYAVTPGRREEPHACDWVSGAFLAVRTEVLDDIGMMDEGFFLYFEETDFCRRAVEAGWDCRCVPAARIVHFEGASTQIKKKKRRRSAYWLASRRRYFAKAYGPAGLIAADLLYALGRSTRLVRRALGIGGGDGASEPLRLGRDILFGDLRSLFGKELTARALEDKF